MTRGWLTSLTLSGLYGAYWLYAAYVGPLTTPQELPAERVHSGPAVEIKPLSIAARVAQLHLPDQKWAQTAKYQWQRGEETFLFFQEQRRIEDDKQNKMRVTPFALVWNDPHDNAETAYTLVCTSADIHFESKLQIGESNPGRIIWGQLFGGVTITGPNGLLIRGQNFVLDESARRLYSGYPVNFSYGPRPGELEQVHGRADQFDILMKESTESLLGRDMPRLGGLWQIKLWRNVELDMVMDDHGMPAPVSLTCKQEFLYDVDSKVATFDEDVHVVRTTNHPDSPKEFDWLKSDRLELTFEEQHDGSRPAFAEAGGPNATVRQVNSESRDRDGTDEFGISLDLEVRRVRALGESVVMGSQENDFTARMQDLLYDIPARTIEMRDNAKEVIARRGSDEIRCPLIRLHHDEDDRIVMAECGRNGTIMRRNSETDVVELDASWSDSLVLSPDESTGLDVLQISGKGRVIQPLQKTGILADSLNVWVDGERIQTAGGDLRKAFASGDRDDLPVRKVIATSNVALVSPRLHLETQRLEADFLAGKVPGNEDQGHVQSSADGSATDSAEQPVLVSAESVTAQLVVDPQTEEADVLRLDAANKVAISRATSENRTDPARNAGDPFTVEAEQLQLRNRNGNHILQLIGSPARLRHPEAELEGGEIFFDRQGNLAQVNGPGALTMLVKTDLEGQELEQPDWLSVRWDEEMDFDGRDAKFFGRIRTTLADSNMLCERLAVSLNERFSFSENRTETHQLEIERVECLDGVTGEYIEWDGTSLVGIRKVWVAELVVDRESGEIHAQGPGRIDDWRRGGGRRHVRLDPTSSADETDVTGRPKFPWEYSRIQFAGVMTGNQRDRFVTLHDRVRVMHGPVEDPLDTIDRNEFSEETERIKNAIWIGSDRLQVRLVGGARGESDETVNVLATGNAELEGKVFRGRADSISYDQSKEMFTLKGRGTEAILWHQEYAGGPYNEVPAKTIQFVPSKSELTLDEARPVRLSR